MASPCGDRERKFIKLLRSAGANLPEEFLCEFVSFFTEPDSEIFSLLLKLAISLYERYPDSFEKRYKEIVKWLISLRKFITNKDSSSILLIQIEHLLFFESGFSPQRILYIRPIILAIVKSLQGRMNDITLIAACLAFVENKNFDFWNNLGASYGKQNKIKEFELIKKIATIGWNKNFGFWNNLGASYGKQNKIKEEELIEKILTIGWNKDFGFWSDLGASYGKQNKIKEFELIQKVAPIVWNKDFNAWNNLGVSYGKQNKYKEFLILSQSALNSAIESRHYEYVNVVLNNISSVIPYIVKDENLFRTFKRIYTTFEEIGRKLLEDLNNLPDYKNGETNKRIFNIFSAISSLIEIQLSINGFIKIYTNNQPRYFSISNILSALLVKDLDLGFTIEQFRGLASKLFGEPLEFFKSKEDFEKAFNLNRGEALLFLYSRPEGSFYEFWTKEAKPISHTFWVISQEPQEKLLKLSPVLLYTNPYTETAFHYKLTDFVSHLDFSSLEKEISPYLLMQFLFRVVKLFVEILNKRKNFERLLKSGQKTDEEKFLYEFLKSELNKEKPTYEDIGKNAITLYEKLINFSLESINLFLKPVVNDIYKKAKYLGLRRLYIVPFGEAVNLPLHAMKTSEGRYLIEEFEIVYAPPLRFQKQNPLEEGIKICAIKGSREFNPSETLKGFDFQILNPEGELGEIRTCGVVHFETHGYVDLEDEFKSSIVLSGKLVPLREFYEKYLPEGYLGVLLACQVGFGKKRGLDLSFSFPLAFALKGYSEFLLPLLDIPYIPTKNFIRRFYEQYFKTHDLATAFRNTALTYIEEERENNLKGLKSLESLLWKISLPFKKLKTLRWL